MAEVTVEQLAIATALVRRIPGDILSEFLVMYGVDDYDLVKFLLAKRGSERDGEE